MAVVYVNDIGLKCRDGSPQMPPRPRIEANLPSSTADGHTIFGHAARQFAALPSDEHLLEPSYAAELTTE